MKKNSWIIWLALKYVFSSKRERLTGIISWIALIGVILSVASLTIVNAVITGFKEVVAEKILSLNPHLSISFYNPKDGERIIGLLKTTINDDLKDIQLVTTQQGLIIRAGQSIGIILKAVDINIYMREKGFKYFKYENFKEEDVIPVVIGNRLKEKLGLSVGDKLNYFSIQGFYTPFGFFPKINTLKVAGYFETGIYDYDFNLIFTPFDYFIKKFQPNNFSIEIKLKDPFKSSEYKRHLLETLGYNYFILDWQEWNKNLFEALKMEKVGLFIILSLMVTVSLFTIISAMIMLVSEKKIDIAILKSLGATSKNILKVFFLAGVFLSGLGVLLGLIIGSLIAIFLSKYPVVKLPGEVYPVEYMPISLQVFDLMLISGTALIISILASLYPAKKASRFHPAEILRKD
ncbi:MAG: FtsX-like permease family protein [Caldimicrobium sp.]